MTEAEPSTGLPAKFWNWKGYNIRYQSAGEENTGGPSLVLIHGFGGNADHWRKNTPELAKAGFRVFALDLIGYGYSDKPDPQSMDSVNGELTRDLDSYLKYAPEGAKQYGGVGETPFTDMAHPLGSGYNFYTWADQVKDFIEEVVGDKAFAICNSIGSCAGMQAAIDYPESLRGVMILDPSLRLLNVKRQNPMGIPVVTAFQTFLRETPVGEGFFSLVAKEQTVCNILKQCYGNPDTVTPELVQAILKPGMTENAPRVFLDFISYSAGPLPEEQLHVLSSEEFMRDGKAKVPVSILWGDKDPWEPLEEGRKYAKYECVEEFVPLVGAGHCPQDEVPELVNPRVVDFVRRHL